MGDEPQVTEQEAPAEAPPVEEQAVQSDLDELQAKAAERDEFLSLAQRTQADFENFRKRAAREQQAAERRGKSGVVKELLPALDNLERALAATTGDDQLAEGIRLVQAELNAALARVGIERISPDGEQFDPNLHEAMATQPVEGKAAGTIVDVYQQGYVLGEDVIRPARVIVAA